MRAYRFFCLVRLLVFAMIVVVRRLHLDADLVQPPAVTLVHLHAY